MSLSKIYLRILRITLDSVDGIQNGIEILLAEVSGLRNQQITNLSDIEF